MYSGKISAAAARPLERMSAGPFSYVHALVTGFLLGSFVFLVFAASSRDGANPDRVPLLLACIAVGAVILASAAAAANYVLGRRRLIARELRRQAIAAISEAVDRVR